MKKLTILLSILLFVAAPLFGQTALTSTTLSSAITTTNGQSVVVASATGITAGSTQIYVDQELMDVRAVSSTVLTVVRGAGGTRAATHASSATAYYGAPNTSFVVRDPVGTCTSTNYPVLPVIAVSSGRRWNCINSVWMVDGGYAFLPFSACMSAVSGNSTGTNGYTTTGASLTPVVQAQTSVTGTNTHTFVCNLNSIAGGLAATPPRNIALLDAVFEYGVQGGALGTQASTAASGTYNSTVVFSSIVYPAAGASETASTVTPVRADSGTMVITPAAASANTATTTAGAFYSQKFTPASPIIMNTDLKQYLFSVTLAPAATTATTTNSPGVAVHYAYIPD